jgi:hypothetical protein
MALFIHNKNQELLWNVINKTQIFQLVFAYSKNNEPELWFRAHIQQYYQKIQNISLTSENLNNCNHEIIAIMMNNLKSFSENLGQPQQQQHQQIPPQQFQQQPQTQLPYTVENKQELYSRQFNERQKEYELMNTKPAPPVPDINNNIKDDAISNMDELIKLHMQQREAEMKQYSPLPLVQPPLENTFKPNNIKIADNNENIRLIPDAVFINEENKLKKNVSWSDDNVNTINEKMYENLHKDYEELKTQVLSISNNFNSFQEEMRIFMSVVINNFQSGNRTQETAQIQQSHKAEQQPIISNSNVNNNTNDFLT